MNEYILNGMAKAFFASAYADQAEENDQALQGEIMDQLPEEIDTAAIHAARTLYADFIKKFNDFHGDGDLMMNGAYIFLHGVDPMPGESDHDKYEAFGHYAAMQSMGHGVGLWDHGCIHQIYDHVPYVEFGSYSLQIDYFLSLEEGISNEG